MNTRRSRMLVGVLAGLAMAGLPAALWADPSPPMPAWYEGEIVFFQAPPASVGGVGVEGKNLLYDFGFPTPLQNPVLHSIPGDPDFNPLWEVLEVIVLDGRNVSVNPFKSEAEILAAQAAGKVAVVDTDFSFLCPVVTRK
jgi:hypothetical protein